MQSSTSVGVVQAMIFSLQRGRVRPLRTNASTYPTVQCRATGARSRYAPSRAFVSIQTRQIVGKIDDVLLGDRPDHLVHGGVIAGALGALVVAQRLQQVILPLRRKPRHLIAAGEVRIVA